MSEIEVTQIDQGRAVDVRVGDTVVIRLDENIATGYSWEPDPADGRAAVLEQAKYVEAAGTAMGRGGTRVLRYAAGEQGTLQVRLRLRRPWDPPERAIGHFGITIRVK
ncbi:MAG TPA: protease inhibitor I42 family protein [Rhodocyclaceae bacterium]